MTYIRDKFPVHDSKGSRTGDVGNSGRGAVRDPRSHRRVRSATAPRRHTVVAFVAPAVIVYVALFLFPILMAMSNGFFWWSGTARGDFAGLQNFRDLFSLQPYASQFWSALWHNLIFFVGTMVLQNGTGLILAFLLNRSVRGKRFFQTVISVPYLMSALVVGYAWSMLLSPQFGLVSGVLGFFGVEPIAWLGTPAFVMPILILINSWQWCGVPMLLFGAGLAGVPEEQVEAARVDGASSLRIAFSIQMPQLVPVWSIITVLTLIGSLNLFDLVYAVGGTSGGVGGAGDVVGTLFYRIAFSNSPNAFGLSGAFSLIQLVLTLVLTIGVQQVFKWMDRRYQ